MKKTLLIFILFISYTFSAQIKVVKNEMLTKVGKEASVTLYKNKNKYTFNYQDVNSSNLNTFRSFSFKDINKDFDNLYKMIANGFISMPEENIILELPHDIIELHFARNFGQKTVQFIHFVNKRKKFKAKSEYLTEKQINKIFGKKKNIPQKKKRKKRRSRR
ncbi:MAG: hypothetical protein CSA38_02270 [Flavobacteriales bacterium]|nr:MAG: hypothetical protein CSA38_02270 [Flavobacteriales bacterium]